MEWVATPSSRGSSQPAALKSLKSPVLAGRFFTTVPPGEPSERAELPLSGSDVWVKKVTDDSWL